jgi:hypothetical protein
MYYMRLSSIRTAPLLSLKMCSLRDVSINRGSMVFGRTPRIWIAVKAPGSAVCSLSFRNNSAVPVERMDARLVQPCRWMELFLAAEL